MELKQRLRYIGSVLTQRKYIAICNTAALAYLLVNLFVMRYIHGTLGGFFNNMYASYTIPFTISTIIIAILGSRRCIAG